MFEAIKNPLINDATLLEFRRTWRFLTGAGVLDHVFSWPEGSALYLVIH